MGDEQTEFQDKLKSIISALPKRAKEVGICVLNRMDNSVGANVGTDGAFVANVFNELASAGYTAGGTEALIARELAGVNLEDCSVGAVPVGSVRQPIYQPR
jgi:hypothetical protein